MIIKKIETFIYLCSLITVFEHTPTGYTSNFLMLGRKVHTCTPVEMLFHQQRNYDNRVMEHLYHPGDVVYKKIFTITNHNQSCQAVTTSISVATVDMRGVNLEPCGMLSRSIWTLKMRLSSVVHAVSGPITTQTLTSMFRRYIPRVRYT